ncbi:MAG: hypothetical protein AABY22_05065 [Nanoarchaeota archaeon]
MKTLNMPRAMRTAIPLKESEESLSPEEEDLLPHDAMYGSLTMKEFMAGWINRTNAGARRRNVQ